MRTSHPFDSPPTARRMTDTLAWLRHGDITAQAEIRINPPRPGRLEPRVRKRAKKQYPYMTQPRATLKSQLRARHEDTS